jgi:hypothetical protein
MFAVLGLFLGASSVQADPPLPASPATTAVSALEPPATSSQSPSTSTGSRVTGDDDMSPSPLEPDFTTVNLATTLRLPRFKSAFRVTHRFTRSLNQGDFGGSAGDLFGLDAGAQIGLEFRFAPARGAQIGIYRTSDKTIDFFGSYSVLQAGDTLPLSLSVIGAVEGTNNFKNEKSPSIGVVLGTTIRNVAAVYVQPTWVGNTNPGSPGLGDTDQTLFLGIGARVRLRRGTFVLAEVSPRLSGFKGGVATPAQGVFVYAPGKTLASFGLEKQVGGHVFQLNVSNGFASTPANIARGAASGRTNWYLGFNISRKFY